MLKKQMFALVKKNIPTPMIIGHEFVGEVAGYGDNVKDFAIGERVSGEGHIVCGRCRNCLAGPIGNMTAAVCRHVGACHTPGDIDHVFELLKTVD